jgi:hypothetical protein
MPLPRGGPGRIRDGGIVKAPATTRSLSQRQPPQGETQYAATGRQIGVRLDFLPMIVWVASYPRSGNRLCRTTLRRVFGVKLVGSAASPASLRKDLGAFLDELGADPDSDPLPLIRELRDPVFLKTHSLPQHLDVVPRRGQRPPAGEEQSPALYLVRDGRDCLVSYARFLRERNDRFRAKTYEETLSLLLRPGRHGGPYGGWSQNVGAWRRRESPTEIIRFERLVEDPAGTVAAATRALGLQLPPPRGQMPPFAELKARRPNKKLLRRGETGSWRSEFPPELLAEFWARHGEEMEAFGYPRE